MQIHDLNTKALTDPAYVAFDDGTDTYKANFKDIIDDAVAEAYADADVSGGVVNFTSHDEIPLSDWNYTEFASLEGGESLEALFELLSKAALNIRWLYDQVSALNSKFTAKSYTVTPAANTSVSPFSAYSELSIAEDVAALGSIVGIRVTGGGSTNPVVVKVNNNANTLWVYAKTAGTAVTVRILFMR